MNLTIPKTTSLPVLEAHVSNNVTLGAVDFVRGREILFLERFFSFPGKEMHCVKCCSSQRGKPVFQAEVLHNLVSKLKFSLLLLCLFAYLQFF